MSEDVQPTLPQPAEPPQEPVNASVSPIEPISPIPTPESTTESTSEPQTEEINEQETVSKPQEPIENIQPTEPQEQPPQPPEPQPSAFQPAPTEQASQIEKPPEDTPHPAGNTEPTKQDTQERVIEKTIPRELNEGEKEALYKTRLKTLGAKAIEAKLNRLQKNLDTIIAKLKESGFITNNEVQKLCNVADSTATKYLKELQKQGLIVPIGRRGRGLRWRLTQAI